MEYLSWVLKELAYFAVLVLLSAFALYKAALFVLRVRLTRGEAVLTALVLTIFPAALDIGWSWYIGQTTQSAEAVTGVAYVMWPATIVIQITLLAFRFDIGFLRPSGCGS